MHLNCHTAFSLRYGVLQIDALVELAAAKGVRSLALTDINNTSAALEFVQKAATLGIQPILGIEFRDQGRLRYIGLAEDAHGWRELCRFLSVHLHGGSGDKDPRPTPFSSRPRQAPASPEEPVLLSNAMRSLGLPARAPDLPSTHFIYPFAAAPEPSTLRPNEWIGIRPSELNRLVTAPCRHFPHKLLPLAPVTFRDKVDYNTHRLLRAIDRNILLSRQDPQDLASPDELLLSEAELKAAYAFHPHILQNALQLTERCHFRMDFKAPKGKLAYTASIYEDRLLLERLAQEGLVRRYGPQHPSAQERMRRELDIISSLGFAAHYLITWDFVRYGQSKGFFHVGRGSGANSVVAYAIGITDVDPIALDLYFERFLNPHRATPPDFDVDYSWADRDQIIQYVLQRYGTAHTSLLATYSTFRGRAVIRELGKVFGLPKQEIDALVAARHSPHLDDKVGRSIERYGRELVGLPNHLGIHPGGLLVTEDPIYSYAATDLPPKGFPTLQIDMITAEDVGLHKFDILSQRGLGHIRDTAEFVAENQGIEIDVHAVSDFMADEQVAGLLRSGRTVGCFYVESPAMRQLLRKLGCEDYPTLVAASSVIRPGVAQSGMMKQYIDRHRIARGLSKPRAGESPDSWYLHPKMREMLGETYGVMVYQEDVIKVAHHVGGLDLAEADILRRAMSGKYRSRLQFDLLQEQFFANCTRFAYPAGLAEEIWRQMESFAGFSFCKAHSASYAVESYQSLYLKTYFPLEFMVGVINNFGGFYTTEVYVHEARLLGGAIHGPCVNQGEYLTCIRGQAIYLGMVHLNGLGREIAELIVATREAGGPFLSLTDLLQRVALGLEQTSLLIRVGALRWTGKTKKQLLWETKLHFSKTPARQHSNSLFELQEKAWTFPDLPDSPIEDAYDSLELLGFFLPSPIPLPVGTPCVHPAFELLANPLPANEVAAKDLEHLIGKRVSLSGYLICTKQLRTIRGDLMALVNLIDRTGHTFDVAIFPDLYKTQYMFGPGIYQVSGRVSDDSGVVGIEVTEIKRLGYIGDPRRL